MSEDREARLERMVAELDEFAKKQNKQLEESALRCTAAETRVTELEETVRVERAAFEELAKEARAAEARVASLEARLELYRTEAPLLREARNKAEKALEVAERWIRLVVPDDGGLEEVLAEIAAAKEGK